MESFAKERSVRLDVFRGHVFKVEGLDDEGLDFVFQIVHQFFIR